MDRDRLAAIERTKEYMERYRDQPKLYAQVKRTHDRLYKLAGVEP